MSLEVLWSVFGGALEVFRAALESLWSCFGESLELLWRVFGAALDTLKSLRSLWINPA